MTSSDPIIIEGPEQSQIDANLPDGGLPLAVGVQSFCVFRASRDVPELADGRGWTYHHHVDMACWKGRLYVGWNSCEKDEDTWPSRELYSTSLDGVTWTEPREMFPQGVSTPLRMYFYRASNGRMLMIAGLRAGTEKTNESRKGGLVVRETRDDHTLGEVWTLQHASTPSPGIPGEGRGEGSSATPCTPPAPQNPHPNPLPEYRERGQEQPLCHFETSDDAGFIDACRQLLADRVFLEQQDRGRLLGPHAMKWHEPRAWPGGKVPGDSDKWVAGKAFSFFRRADGQLIGLSKMGWVTTSDDNGNTWSQPVVPPTLTTGKAKIWSQRTSDGRYALVYNPSRRQRFPLVVVTSDDGRVFRDMLIIQGELPIQRYAGRDRSIGPQYVRGISAWSDDRSRADEQVMWLVYSMNKEDIWVSRVPLPIRPDESDIVDDDFATFPAGPIVRGWNTYCPKWASVKVADGCLEIIDRDLYDHAVATRLFRAAKRVSITFETAWHQFNADATLEIELLSTLGSRRPVRVVLNSDRRIKTFDGQSAIEVAQYTAGQWLTFRIDAEAECGEYSLALNDRPVVHHAAFTESCEDLNRITFRTGEWRSIGGHHPVPPGSDRPHEPLACRIRRLTVLTVH
jgi:hypothetical protein